MTALLEAFDADPISSVYCWEHVAGTVRPAALFPYLIAHYPNRVTPETSCDDVWDWALDAQPDVPQVWHWYATTSQYRTDVDAWAGM